MRPELAGITRRQHFVFSRRQALAAGCRERELKTRTGARGDWVVVRRGVYAPRDRWDDADEAERYRMRVWATHLTASRGAVHSHASAAALLGLPLRPRWLTLTHVTRAGVRGGRCEGGVKHHRAAYDPWEVVEHDGLWCTGLARTAVDLGRELGFEDGLVAADAALNRGARRGDLDRVLERMWCWPGITAARAAAELADGGAQSIGETLTRILVLELGQGRPETQVAFEDGSRRAEVDLRLRRHLIEFDGKVKYVGRDRGGVDDRRPDEILWAEKRREDWLRSHDGGYGMSRVVWADLLGPHRDRTRERLARDLRRSDELYGHLVEDPPIAGAQLASRAPRPRAAAQLPSSSR